MKVSTLTVSLINLSSVLSWSPSLPVYQQRQRAGYRRSSGPLSMALDYNDPIVGAEFVKVQSMTFEECEEECLNSGVVIPQTMNEMDAKLMLVELRMRLNGSFEKSEDLVEKKKEMPASFSSKFEEALWTKPSFKELYDVMKERGDMNSMNVAAEYVNDPAMARTRYKDSYGSTLDQIDKALTTELPVTSPTVKFSGFPANMGEAGCKMTLEALGDIEEFTCTESEDFPVLQGQVTFGDIDTAKAAIKQYNGMDMGMGSKLELTSV